MTLGSPRLPHPGDVIFDHNRRQVANAHVGNLRDEILEHFLNALQVRGKSSRVILEISFGQAEESTAIAGRCRLLDQHELPKFLPGLLLYDRVSLSSPR